MTPYPWESNLLKCHTAADRTCEYGYPKQCGKPADFVFDRYAPAATPDGRKIGYPDDLYSCREHVFAMKTGVEPRVIVRTDQQAKEVHVEQ